MSKIIAHTGRLILREFVPEDVESLSRILCDPLAMRFYPAPLDRDQVAEWIARNQSRYREHGHGLWAMLLKSSGELIGDCGLTKQTVEGEDEIELGYHVRRDLWGHGFAPEAAGAARDWGFGNLDVAQLISLVRVGNVPSRRVAEKVGMVLWKTLFWRDVEHWVMRLQRKPNKKGRAEKLAPRE